MDGVEDVAGLYTTDDQLVARSSSWDGGVDGVGNLAHFCIK